MVQAQAELDLSYASFGPISEQVVPANNEFPYPWFDLDTGKVIAVINKVIAGLGDDEQDSADFVAIVEPGHRGLSTAEETGFGSVPWTPHSGTRSLLRN